MKLKSLTISGFRSFSREPATRIDFEDDLTLLIGANGTGKTALLGGLAKMFGVQGKGLEPSDFYLAPHESPQLERQLYIDAIFSFSELNAENANHSAAVPTCFHDLTCNEQGEVFFRARLEASLSFQSSILGDIDEEMFTISTLEPEFAEDRKKRLRPSVRNRIQVHYVSATRDPLREIGLSSTTILGRLLKAGSWSGEYRDRLREQTRTASQLLEGHPAVEMINQTAREHWQKYHRGDYLREPSLQFLPPDLEGFLGQAGFKFRPSPGGAETDLSRLSEGERSLFYLTLVQMAHSVEASIAQNDEPGATFKPDRLLSPAFTMLAVEEPENHLAPHYLSRILTQLLEFGKGQNAQSVVSTHSASMCGRAEPRCLRYLRLDPDGRITRIRGLTLPQHQEDAYNYVIAALQAYPDLLFARLVIIGEGDTERLVLPRLFAALAEESPSAIHSITTPDLLQPIYTPDRIVDSTFVSIIPIGGRHVNHIWKLLSELQIPFLTILDLDLGRYQGGWGRIRYVLDQLRAINWPDLDEQLAKLAVLPDWDSPIDPSNPKNPELNYVEALEDFGVYFASPLDMDFLMLQAFPAAYQVLEDWEQGPRAVTDKKGAPNEVLPELLKAVLKGNANPNASDFYSMPERCELLPWYRYRFLSRSKPTSHLVALHAIHTAEVAKNSPEVIKRLLRTAVEKVKQLPE